MTPEKYIAYTQSTLGDVLKWINNKAQARYKLVSLVIQRNGAETDFFYFAVMEYNG